MSRITCIAAVCLCLPHAQAIAQSALRLTYEVKVGGLSAADIQLEATLKNAEYRIATRIESQGIIGVLTGFHSDARSSGDLAGGRPQPREHRADNRWLGDSRWVWIRQEPGRAPAFEALPRPEDDDRDPVSPERTVGALDPLSAALRVALAARDGEACRGRLDIFDGRRRYALEFGDRRQEGGMLRCRVRLERIAGHSRDPWLPVMRPVETAELWIAPPRDGLPPLPLKLEAETGLGTAVVRLTAVDVAP